MKEEWKKVRLSEIADYVSERIFLENLSEDDYISTENMLAGKNGITKCATIPEASAVPRYVNGDVLVSNIRPYFKKIWYADRIGGCSNDVIVFRVKDGKKVDSKYLYYLLSQDAFFDHMMAGANGTKMPRGNKKLIPNFESLAFPLPTQQKIASILSAYDDLIENNRRQIKLLEEAALKLYKEWFVKLNFPGHENTKIVDGIPEGWKKEKISDWCRVFTGKKNANQNVEKGVYPFFTCAPDPLLSNDSLYEGKAVIISGNGSYTGRTQFYDGHFDLYQRTYACVKQKAVGYEYMPFIYYSMKVLFEPIKMGGTKGAAIPYIVMNDITDTEFLYNEEICKKYSGFAEITLDKIGALKKQIQLLQLARDKLLPKLMNGEIEV
ncbi:MAG: restriction endonuclease subunit S [Spirochaetia bacterium]|nr:restriction endonuclease subunit S [Spirochaetia bacterium]